MNLRRLITQRDTNMRFECHIDSKRARSPNQRARRSSTCAGAVMNYYTNTVPESTVPESTGPAELNRHLYGDQ